MERRQIARRLKAVRESLGFTQAVVAEALGVHRPTISEIEAGRRAVTSEELYRLAQIYGRPVSDLLQEARPGEEEAMGVLFRRDGLETPAARAAVSRFLERCRAEKELEELLGIPAGPDARPGYHAPAPRDVLDAIRQGERIAEGERRRLDLGVEPLRNPLELLEKQGVRIGPIEGLGDDDGVDGLYVELEDLGACVAVNPHRDEWTGFRSAFTAAHEYAHWLLRDVTVEEFSFGRKAGDLLETRANAFAAAFLMPRAGLEAYFTGAGLLRDGAIPHLSAGDIVRAMDHFGVSRQALLFRLENVRLLPHDLAETLRDREIPVTRLAETLGIQLWRGSYFGGRLPALATEGWRRGLLSAGRAAALCDLDLETFQERMRELGEVQEPDQGEALLGAAGG